MNIALPGVAQRVAVIQATRALTAASGDVAYTGVGFRPRAVVMFTNRSTAIERSFAASSGVGADFGFSIDTAGQTFGIALLADLNITAGDIQRAALASFDADGLTITWTKFSTPTGTAQMAMVLFE